MPRSWLIAIVVLLISFVLGLTIGGISSSDSLGIPLQVTQLVHKFRPAFLPDSTSNAKVPIKPNQPLTTDPKTGLITGGGIIKKINGDKIEVEFFGQEIRTLVFDPQNTIFTSSKKLQYYNDDKVARYQALQPDDQIWVAFQSFNSTIVHMTIFE